MNMLDVLMIAFSAVAVNHLGLVVAIERTVKHRLPIIDCPKCLTFWAVCGYGIAQADDPLTVVAVALLAAWAAIWLELLMGFIDRLYIKAYEQIYPAADTADADKAGASGTMPVMPGEAFSSGKRQKKERNSQ